MDGEEGSRERVEDREGGVSVVSQYKQQIFAISRGEQDFRHIVNYYARPKG